MSTIDLNTIISPFLSNSIQSTLSFGIADFISENDRSINTSVLFSNDISLNRFIDFDIQFIEDIITQQVTPYLPELILNIGTAASRSILSTAIVSSLNVVPVIAPATIPSTLVVNTDKELNIAFDAPSIGVSTQIGLQEVFVSIGATSTVLTTSFGLPSIPRVVHRSLIFKDDNISKLGNDDDVEIASGIVIHSGTQTFTGNTLPEATAGYVLVTINGVDYKMPFFNL